MKGMELWGTPEKYNRAYGEACDKNDKETTRAMMDWEEETWRREELEKIRSHAG